MKNISIQTVLLRQSLFQFTNVLIYKYLQFIYIIFCNESEHWVFGFEMFCDVGETPTIGWGLPDKKVRSVSQPGTHHFRVQPNPGPHVRSTFYIIAFSNPLFTS
jgi:hypothetical protein